MTRKNFSRSILLVAVIWIIALFIIGNYQLITNGPPTPQQATPFEWVAMLLDMLVGTLAFILGVGYFVNGVLWLLEGAEL